MYRNDRGFTLIEAVVALAILTMTLTVAYQSFSGSLRRATEQRHRTEAWLMAQSILSELRANSLTGHRSGQTSQGLNWTAVIAPYEPPVIPMSPFSANPPQVVSGTPLQAEKISITVRWQGPRNPHIELRSIEWGASP